MEIVEETEELGSVGKTRHMKISRKDTFVNDMKNSTVQGLLSVICAAAGLAVLLTGLYQSYRSAGQAGYAVGLMMIASLMLAVGGIILGIAGLKNRKKIRHYNEKRGIILGAVLCAVLAFIYVRGVIGYFAV